MMGRRILICFALLPKLLAGELRLPPSMPRQAGMRDYDSINTNGGRRTSASSMSMTMTLTTTPNMVTTNGAAVT